MSSDLTECHSAADQALRVRFHDLNGFSSVHLEVHQPAIYSLLRAKKFELEVSRKGGERLLEILSQVLLSTHRAGTTSG